MLHRVFFFVEIAENRKSKVLRAVNEFCGSSMADDEFEEDVKPEHKPKKTLKKDKYGALVLVIDCGNSMQETSGGRSHFSMAKEAADWILSRKVSSSEPLRNAQILSSNFA